MLLEGKTAIITGARRGIGRATLECFTENGACVFACARRKDEQFEEEMRVLAEQYRVEIFPIYFDLAEQESISAGVREINAYKKKIDILVNCAGIADGGPLNLTSMKRLEEVFRINYFAQIQMMQLVSRIMIRQKSGGSIVNVASVGGLEAIPGYLSYGSSKAALIWATRCLSKELGPQEIRVNAVAPGMTNTDMGGAFKTQEALQSIIDRTGLRRMAQPREIAEAIVFLASDKASYINGEILQADGGRI